MGGESRGGVWRRGGVAVGRVEGGGGEVPSNWAEERRPCEILNSLPARAAREERTVGRHKTQKEEENKHDIVPHLGSLYSDNQRLRVRERNCTVHDWVATQRVHGLALDSMLLWRRRAYKLKPHT